MPQLSTSQVTLDIERGILEKNPHLLDCVRAAAYGHRNPLKTIAADMDMSQSDLSRKLAANPEDSRRFSLDDLESFLDATGDLTPIVWLVAKYMQDGRIKRERAIQELARMLPDLQALLAAATEAA